MKIVLEVNDYHTPALLELLADLIDMKNRNADRLATDYEKLLEGEAATEQEDQATAGGADWSPMNPPEPLTAAPELPMPSDLPELPPLPGGKSRWAYLGKFDDSDIPTANVMQFPTREIWWWSENAQAWIQCWSLNGAFHHIEAI